MNSMTTPSPAEPDPPAKTPPVGGVSVNSAGGPRIGGDVVGRDKTSTEITAGDHVIQAAPCATVIVGQAPETAPLEDEAPTPGEPPFKGLLYFDEADAGLFFGREALAG